MGVHIMSYLSYEERLKIETYVELGLSQREIARRLNRHYNTIYNELKRGTICKRMYDYSDKYVYDAYRGQAVCKERSLHKGVDIKLGNNKQLADYLESKIIKEKYSPYAALQSASENYNVNFCLRTFYSYIHKHVFYELSDKHIKKQKKKPENVELRPAYNNKNVKLITERPVSASERSEFGHWEMDTVISGRGDTSCLLVLTERKTRIELIRKIANKSMSAVCSALDDIERDNAGYFRNIFKTITCDNGCEFLDAAGIEKSCYTLDNRTTVYYCHPFASSERGSNENANKLIRKWFVKGSHVSDYSDEYTYQVQCWMNSYPRKLFNGLSAYDMLQREGVELII